MATFLICHGAWSAGWAWKKVRPLLRAAGHEVFTPTYTGLGERAHQASPTVDLETHIKDVLAVIEFEDLQGFHPGGAQLRRHGRDRGGRPGARAREAADLSRRLRAGEWAEPARPPRAGAASGCHAGQGEDWLIPPNPTPPDTSAADLAWITPRRRPQPVKTFTQPLQLRNPELRSSRAATSIAPRRRRTTCSCSSPSASSPIRVALLRDRRQPQPQRDGAGGAGAAAGPDRALTARVVHHIGTYPRLFGSWYLLCRLGSRGVPLQRWLLSLRTGGVVRSSRLAGRQTSGAP